MADENIKSKNIWKILLMILIVLFVGSFIAGVYGYLFLFSNNTQVDRGVSTSEAERIKSNNQKETKNLEDTAIQVDDIDFLLEEIGAQDLHNAPLSSQPPVIEIKVDNEVFSSHILDGKIVTERKESTEKDIRIYTNKDTVKLA